eukprot:SAG22_NODE_15038_length_359_cov_0.461538_2_plen_47_part_01
MPEILRSYVELGREIVESQASLPRPKVVTSDEDSGVNAPDPAATAP